MPYSGFQLLVPRSDTHPRNCLRVGHFISSCEYKATTDHIAQFSIEIGMSGQWELPFTRRQQELRPKCGLPPGCCVATSAPSNVDQFERTDSVLPRDNPVESESAKTYEFSGRVRGLL